MNLFPLLYLIPYVIGQVSTVHQDINASKNGSSGAFTSPGYPKNYPNNAHFTWTLKTGDSNATVIINITDFNVVKYRYTSKCEDYLQIEKTDPCCMEIIKRCGNFSTIDWVDTGNIFMITFVSDNIHNSRGFKLSWRVYISDIITTQPTTTTTKRITTTEQATTTTTKATSSKTTTISFPITKKSTSTEIQTLTSALLTPEPEQPRANTTNPFTKDTESYVAKDKAHTTTETKETLLTKTDLVGKTTTLISTQPITEKNNTIGLPERSEKLRLDGRTVFATVSEVVTKKTRSHVIETLGTKEILYLVAGIGVVEFTLVALGIYIVKQRRASRRHLDTGKPDKEKNRPVSRKSVASVGNIYESIPMEHFSIKDAIPEEDENVYTEVPEHMYDKTFEHRPRVNVNANLYPLISELKTKNR